MKLSFAQKLWLPLVLSLLCLAGMSIYSAYEGRQSQLEDRKLDLIHACDIALSIIKTYGDAVATGALSEAQAKKQAMDKIRAIRYGGEGYFAIIDSKATVLMHPTRPEMEGKDASSYRDPNGVYVFRAAVDAIRRSGKGFNEYAFPRPGSAEASRKISFNASYQPWDWILTTGVYIDDIDSTFRSTLYRSFGALLLMVMALSAVVVFLNRGIIRALGGEPSYAAAIANQIASNDLTAEVKTARDDDESLLFSMKSMQEQLTQTIGAIKVSADSIASASHQIAAGNQNLSQRTEEQAASLEQTAASMEQLTSTVSQNADHAHKANHLAAQAVKVAEHGGSVVSRVVETMNSINASSGRIGDIVGMIESIAFQTNILALNAAVEAARAGEQGRGFAVVASEVRSLAQRSSTASKEIRALIHDSVERVRTGAGYAEEAGEAMARITQEVKRVTEIMNEIAASTQEQSKGIGEVNVAITQMDQVTQQNAALVEEAAAAASSLEVQADDLKVAVAAFRLNIASGPGGRAAAQARRAVPQAWRDGPHGD